MNGFAAGVDGGGTKTALCCVGGEDQTLGRAVFGALNVNGAPKAQVRDTLGEILRWIRDHEAKWGPCRALVVGTAGASNPEAVSLMEETLREGGYTGTLRVTGDQQIALRGAVGRVGAVLIAGTGTICCGQNAQGESHRSGGYGYLIDDEGSGYAIGRDILSAVVRAQDGRGVPTVLTEIVFRHLGISGIPELIRVTYQNATEKRHMAALAPLLLQGLEQGDTASVAIAERAAYELSLLLATVLRRLQLEDGPFAFVGGVLSHYPSIAGGVLTHIQRCFPRARHIQPQGDAAMGAAQLAWDEATGEPPNRRST